MAINYTLQEFKDSARTYRKDFLRLPILALADDLKFMTPRFGVRYSEVQSAPGFDVELRPYKRSVPRPVKDLDLVQRDLKTYFGALDVDFDPNSAIQTIIGHRAAQAVGQGLQSTPTAREAIALAAKSVGYKLKLSLCSAVRDDNGTTTQDLFNGFDTITSTEMAATNISVANKNLFEVAQKPDASNAVRIAKAIMRAMSPELRAQECFMFCSQNFADDYNESYLETHRGIVYNDKYNQVSVEGSNGMLTIVPLLSKADSNLIHITPKANMLVGMDQMSDTETVKIGDYDPDLITLSMRMFFGVEFESIDPRRMLVAKLPD